MKGALSVFCWRKDPAYFGRLAILRSAADVGSEQSIECFDPHSDRLKGCNCAALSHSVLGLSQTAPKVEIQPNRLGDLIGRETVAAIGANVVG